MTVEDSKVSLFKGMKVSMQASDIIDKNVT
jgi:hypothetical protein